MVGNVWLVVIRLRLCAVARRTDTCNNWFSLHLQFATSASVSPDSIDAALANVTVLDADDNTFQLSHQEDSTGVLGELLTIAKIRTFA